MSHHLVKASDLVPNFLGQKQIIKLTRVFRPMCLSAIQNFNGGEVFQVFVVGDYVYWVQSTTKIVSPDLEHLEDAILFSPPHSLVGVRWTGLDSTGLHQTDQTHPNLCLICNKSSGVRWSPLDCTGPLLKFLDGNRVLDLTRAQSSLPSPVDSTRLWKNWKPAQTN